MNVLRKEVLIRQVSFKSHRRHFHVVLVSRKYTLTFCVSFSYIAICFIFAFYHIPSYSVTFRSPGFSRFSGEITELIMIKRKKIIAWKWRHYCFLLCRGPPFLTMPTNSALLPNSAARSPDRHKTRANYRPATCLLGGEWVKW